MVTYSWLKRTCSLGGCTKVRNASFIVIINIDFLYLGIQCLITLLVSLLQVKLSDLLVGCLRETFFNELPQSENDPQGGK